MNKLNGKVVIVTGGAGLIGREYIKAIVKNGGIGVIADINEIAGREAARAINLEYKSKNAVFVKLDINSRASICGIINKLLKKYGKIDALVNNAYPRNRNYGKKIEDVAYKDFCENINMHLGGYFLVSQQIAGLFRKQGHGNIINMASIYGVVAPRFEIYSGTSMTNPIEYGIVKSAIIYMTKYLAKYFKGSGIRVNCVSPGGIMDRQPSRFVAKYNEHCLSKGMLDKSDIAGTILFLLSDLSTYINGQNIVVDDGFCL